MTDAKLDVVRVAGARAAMLHHEIDPDVYVGMHGGYGDWLDLVDAVLAATTTSEGGAEVTWQPIETAPKDGTRIDLWMVDETGESYREAGAYWKVAAKEVIRRFTSEGKTVSSVIVRDGWWGPNHDYDGVDGFADTPRWYNEHPNQRKWVGCNPTHWMPIPDAPTTIAEEGLR